MATVEVDGLRLAYRTAGSGPPVVLLHGAMLDADSWRRQLDGLADRWHVVAWDMPGCGGSDDAPEGWRLEDYARCVVGLCRALQLERPHVVGLSFGAGLALAVEKVAPGLAASLVLVSGYAGWRGSLPADEVEARLSSVVDVGPHPPEPRLADGLEFTGEGTADDVLEELLEQARRARWGNAAVAARAFAEADLTPGLASIAVPVLVLCGEQDRRSPVPVSRALAEAIPGAQLVVVPEVGHMVPMEAPDLFAAAVRPFLVASEQAAHRR